MTELANFTFELFFLIFARVMAFIAVAPTFTMRGIPTAVKIGLSLFLSFIVFNLLPTTQFTMEPSLLSLATLAVGEVILGLSVGFLANLIFLGISMGGQFIDFQMGLSIGSVYDPATQSQSTLFGSLYNWMALMLLFAINGHHYMLYAIVKCFNIMPAGSVDLSKFHADDIVPLFTSSIKTAFQISIPILIILILIDVIMGVIARTVPQLQIFILAIPIKIIVGILFLLTMATTIFASMIPLLEEIPFVIENGLKAFM